jgi:hypothetical protein
MSAQESSFLDDRLYVDSLKYLLETYCHEVGTYRRGKPVPEALFKIPEVHRDMVYLALIDQSTKSLAVYQYQTHDGHVETFVFHEQDCRRKHKFEVQLRMISPDVELAMLEEMLIFACRELEGDFSYFVPLAGRKSRRCIRNLSSYLSSRKAEHCARMEEERKHDKNWTPILVHEPGTGPVSRIATIHSDAEIGFTRTQEPQIATA